MTASRAANDGHPRVLRGLLPIDRRKLPRDVVAGITLAALGIPVVMGYTKIAGTPVVTGLYTLLLPGVAFAVLGGSRHLVVSADSATAAILAATLGGAAAFGTPAYAGLTSLVALLVAGMLLVARLFKLGFLADFLSRSALIGFLTGVGIQVAVCEFGGLLGLPKDGHGTLGQLASVFERLPMLHVATLVLSAVVLVVILGLARIAPRVPGALIAVVGAILASVTLDLPARGITTVGSVPGGLPSLALPDLRVGDLFHLVACAASCFIVIVAQSAATARAYALRHGEQFAEDRDLVGLAGANAAAAVTGTFVVNGSPTQTEIVDEAGGRSQAAHLTTALVVAGVLLFLTRPLEFLPDAVLSAIVCVIGMRLVDVRGMRELWRLQRNEFWIAAATAATVVTFTVMDGIVVAVVLSLVEQVRHTYRPRRYVVVRGNDGHWRAIAPTADRLVPPGILIYRFEANLFYANSSLFMEEILRLVSEGEGRVKGVVLDASGIDDVDFTAARMLQQVRDQLGKCGVATAVVAANDGVRADLRRYGLGAGAAGMDIYPVLDDAVAALGAAVVDGKPASSEN